MPTRLLRPVRTWRGLTDDERTTIRNTAATVLPFVLLAVISLGVLMYTFTQPLRITPPLSYSATSYSATPSVVCPGDTMTWHINLTVSRVPVMVISVRSIWDVEKNQTARTAENLEASSAVQFTNWTDLTNIDRDVTMEVPHLPPGRYEVRSAVQEFNSQAAAYKVPFSVRSDCR